MGWVVVVHLDDNVSSLAVVCQKSNVNHKRAFKSHLARPGPRNLTIFLSENFALKLQNHARCERTKESRLDLGVAFCINLDSKQPIDNRNHQDRTRQRQVSNNLSALDWRIIEHLTPAHLGKMFKCLVSEDCSEKEKHYSKKVLFLPGKLVSIKSFTNWYLGNINKTHPANETESH